MAVRTKANIVTARRIGSETSGTRSVMLDNAEQLMLDEGYAAVTYRRVAAQSAVTAGLVQYYFPTLDELFIALLRRHSDQNLEILSEALRDHAEHPLRVIWNRSRDETTAALMVEFMALANHRKAIQVEISVVGERSKKLQLEALFRRWAAYDIPVDTLTPEAAQVLLAGIPKILLLEGSLDERVGHADILTLVDTLLESLEPSHDVPGPSKRKGKKGSIGPKVTKSRQTAVRQSRSRPA